MSHGYPVTDADGRYHDGCSSRHPDSCLHGFGDLIQVHVAGYDLAVSGYHADQRPLEFFLGVAHGVKEAPHRSALGAFGHVVAYSCHWILLSDQIKTTTNAGQPKHRPATRILLS